MSARDDVLAAVRAALGPGREASAPGAASATHVTASGAVDAPRGVLDRTAMLDLFAERVADYRDTVTR